ncbi:hypothetical protein EDB84DRAFT_1622063 [Lactarius hengduanensis]|nr:hypothetical protein EDB84DRAFT_1622063 [Lactarius hengduanensis]
MTTDATSFLNSGTNLPRVGLRDLCNAFRLLQLDWNGMGRASSPTSSHPSHSSSARARHATSNTKGLGKKASMTQPSTGPPAFTSTSTPATAEADELRQAPYLAPPCSPSRRCGGYSPMRAASRMQPDDGHKRCPSHCAVSTLFGIHSTIGHRQEATMTRIAGSHHVLGV